MDPITFGPFPASRVLADKLAALNDPNLTRRVLRRLNRLNEGLNLLSDVDSRHYRRRFALLWRNAILESVEFHPEIDDYVRNVVHSFAKDLLGGKRFADSAIP